MYIHVCIWIYTCRTSFDKTVPIYTCLQFLGLIFETKLYIHEYELKTLGLSAAEGVDRGAVTLQCVAVRCSVMQCCSVRREVLSRSNLQMYIHIYICTHIYIYVYICTYI